MAHQTVQELLDEAHAIGITDGFGFAEWVVQVKDYFGNVERLPIEELEQAIEGALGWWDTAHRQPRGNQ